MSFLSDLYRESQEPDPVSLEIEPCAVCGETVEFENDGRAYDPQYVRCDDCAAEEAALYARMEAEQDEIMRRLEAFPF